MKDDHSSQMTRFRTWMRSNSILRVLNGFMPTFLDGDSRSVTVVLDDKMQPCTDGETIWVSLIPQALSEVYCDEDWLLMLQAAAAHEAQHVNSSNFDDIVQIRDWYGAYLKDNFGVSKSIGGPIAKEALNIMEDGRIEGIAVRRRKGLYIPLMLLNQIIRDGTTIKPYAGDPKKEYADFWGQVLSYTKTGLYAPGIKFYENSELERVFLSISGYIDQGVCAKSSQECRRLTEAMLTEVAPYIAKLIGQSAALQASLPNGTPDEYTSNSGQPDAGDGDGTEGASGDSDDSGAGGNPLRASSPGNPGDGKGDTGKSGDSQQAPMGFSESNEKGTPISEQDLDEARKLMSGQISAVKQAEMKQPPTGGDSLDEKSVAEIRASYSGRTAPVNIDVFQSPHSSRLPVDLSTQAAVLRREILRITEQRRRVQQGLRCGVLDQGVLWKLGVQDGTVFRRNGNKGAGKCAISLIVDNSGSMGERIGGSTKSGLARCAAAVIEEAASGIVPFKVALFDQSGGGVNHTVIRGFDSQGKGNRTWDSIRAIGPHGCNRDSVHIRIAAEELLRRREQKRVLIVLSDGQPSAYSSQASAQAEVLNAVRAARRKGVIVFAIMYGNAQFLTSSRESYEAMYEKDIIACQPSEVISRLALLFRQVVLR